MAKKKIDGDLEVTGNVIDNEGEAKYTKLYRHLVTFHGGESDFEFINANSSPLSKDLTMSQVNDILRNCVRFVDWYNYNGLGNPLYNPFMFRYDNKIYVFGFTVVDPSSLRGGSDDSEDFLADTTLETMGFVSDTVTPL